MGKAQSKRSVDITTEGKKEEEVIAGKMEKIEDAEDQKPQVNGDATAPENDAKEKKETEESENDKDATTEKSSGEAGGGGGGDESAVAQPQLNGEQNGEKEGEAVAATTPKDESKEASGDAGAAGAEEEISPLADDSSKKTKKEKVKKKWSFRSISFGKKDKQKPAKSEAEAVSPTTNGETTDKSTDAANTDEAAKKEETGDVKPPTENGDASEKELLNGEGGETATTTTTTTPTEDKSATVATNNELTNENSGVAAPTAAAASTNNTTTSSSTTTSPSTAPIAAAVTAVATNVGANGIETDHKIANDVATPILSNGNGNVEDAIKNDIPVPKQNGTNGQDHSADDDDEQTQAVDIKAVSKSIEYHSVISFDKKIPTIIEETVANDGDGEGDGNGAGNDDDISNINLNNKATVEIVEDIGAGGDIGEINSKEEEIIVSEEKLVEPPPPLPISPPPSQVVAFALNSQLADTEIIDKWDKMENVVETVQELQIPIVNLESEFSKPIEPLQKAEDNIINEIKLDEGVALPEIETTVVTDIDIVEEPKVLEMTAAVASLMVDEVTAKAVVIVNDMSKELESGNTDEEQVTVSNCVEEMLVDEEDLPSPPPSPPPPGEEFFEQCEEDSGTVEDVLNQFESKMNEIEQKVMNFDDNASEIQSEELLEQIHSDVDVNPKECCDMENPEENFEFELCQTSLAESDIQVVEVMGMDSNQKAETESNAQLSENELPAEIANDVEFDKTENETTSEDNENLIDNVEQNGNGLKPNDDNENAAHDNESHKEADKIETSDNNDNMESRDDPTDILVDEINKWTLNDQVDVESEAITKQKQQLNDFGQVKEINPIELKEAAAAAAAAEITTQELAVSCD